MSNSAKVALVIGAGVVTGDALAGRFAIANC